MLVSIKCFIFHLELLVALNSPTCTTIIIYYYYSIQSKRTPYNLVQTTNINSVYIYICVLIVLFNYATIEFPYYYYCCWWLLFNTIENEVARQKIKQPRV